MDKKLITFFEKAYAYVQEKFPDDLKYTIERPADKFDDWGVERFLRQYVWVVYGSNFKIEILGKKFPEIEKAFCNFDIEKICQMDSIDPILKVFGNKKKATCILNGAKKIKDEGFDNYKKRILEAGKEKGREILDELPGIGPITRDLLAKDIGVVDTQKDDVHIQRLVELCDAKNSTQMVDFIIMKCSDKLCHVAMKKALVDSVLWRFCATECYTVDLLKSFWEAL